MATVEVQQYARLDSRGASAGNPGDILKRLCTFASILLAALLLTLLFAGCNGESSSVEDPVTRGSAIKGIWIGQFAQADLAALEEGALPAPEESLDGLLEALSDAAVLAEGDKAATVLTRMQFPNALVCALSLADGRLSLIYFGRDLEEGQAVVQVLAATRDTEETQCALIESPDLLSEVARLAGQDPRDILPELSPDVGSETWGLWAGVVETIPERPASLSASFYEVPSTSTTVHTDAYMDIGEIEKPLWVFADEVDLADCVDEIHQALGEGRPVVVAEASPQEVQELLLGVPALGESETVPADDWVVFYTPWRGTWGTMSGVSGNLFHAMAEVTLQK